MSFLLNKLKYFLCLILSCIVLSASPTAIAAPSTMIATGYGNTHSAALHDAMRNAIEQKIGLLLDSNTIVQNYQTIADTIYTHTEGYISDYSILQETKAVNGYKITAQITVNDSLDTMIMNQFQKTKIIETLLQDPRIGVVIMDRNGTEHASAENSLINSLKNNGFSHIVDLSQVEQSQKLQLTAAVLKNEVALSQMLQTQFPVDYIVIGQVDVLSAQPAASRGFRNFINGQALLSLRLYNMNTGEIIYTDTINGSALHTNYELAAANALAQASQKAASPLSQALLKKAANPLSHLHIVITDAKLGDIQTAQQYLAAISGVTQVYLRSSNYDAQSFDLNYYGSMTSFAAALNNIGITIKEIGSDFIKI